MLFLVGVLAVMATPGARANDLKPQPTCPIMGGKINKEAFVDVAGYRFYACCPACLPKIKADPAKALATLKERGEKPELHLAICPKCGEIKGTSKCCKVGVAKCSKCGLAEGAPGCCKICSFIKWFPRGIVDRMTIGNNGESWTW